MEALGNWQQKVLRQALSHYLADDIFNADETGLFWQLLPNKTLSFKRERCTSRKKSKERITVLVGNNMSGTEKLPLLVIGKLAKPCAFKNKEVPLIYKANRKAWMTVELFEGWLKHWDRKLEREGRKVLLFLDNFSGHSKIQLEQIMIKFLPPNTTAASQPMDQGIIRNLKVHYRRFFLREKIAAFDAKTDFKMDLYKALQSLRRSWADVKPETLANCFLKAGFVKEVQAVQPTLEEQINVEVQVLGEEQIAELMVEQVQTVEGDPSQELTILWTKLQQLELAEGDLEDYLTVDGQLATAATRTLAEIAAGVSTTKVEEPDSDSGTELIEIEEEPEPPITSREAAEAFRFLQRYADTNANPTIRLLCDKVDDLLAKERLRKLKQENLLNYFTP